MAVAGNIVVRLTGDIKGLQASLARATKSVRTTGRAVKRDAQQIGRSLRTIGVAAGVVGGAAVKMAADFDTGVREIGTLLGGLTNDEIAGMKTELQDLAIQSGQSIETLTGARYDIISTGFADAADSAEILSVSAEAAVGAVSDVNTVAGVVTQTLKAYNLEAEDARKVTDVLTTTVQLGRTTMDELGASLGTVLATAKTAGLSIEGLGAAIATATPVIGDSQQTTVALNNALFSLDAPADEARKAMEQFGVEVMRLDDGTLDLVATMEQFQGMDLATIRQIIPEKRAARIVQVLANDTQTLADNLGGMNNAAGKTRQFFEDIASGPGFQLSQLWEQMKGQLRDLGTELLPSVATAARGIGDAMRNNSGAIQGFIEQTGQIVEWLVRHGDIIGKIFVVTTITAVTVKVGGLAVAVGSLVKNLGLMAGAVASLVGWPALIVAGVVSAIATLQRFPDATEQVVMRSKQFLFGLNLAFKAVVLTARDVVQNFSSLMHNLGAIIIWPFELGLKILQGFAKSWRKLFGGMSQVVAGFFQAITGDFDQGWKQLQTGLDNLKDGFSNTFIESAKEAATNFQDRLIDVDFSDSEKAWKKAGAEIAASFKEGLVNTSKIEEYAKNTKITVNSELRDTGYIITPIQVGSEKAGKEMKENLGNASKDAGKTIRNEMTYTQEIVSDGFASMWQSIINTQAKGINDIIDLEMTGAERREQIWQSMLRTFSRIIGEMTREWVAGTTAQTAATETAAADSAGAFAAMGSKIKGVAAAVFTPQGAVVAAAIATFLIIRNNAEEIGKFIGTTFTNMGNLIKEVFRGVGRFVKNVFDGIGDAAVTLAEGIGKAFETIGEVVGDIGGGFFRGIRSIGEGIWSGFKDLIGLEHGGLVTGPPEMSIPGTTDSVQAVLTPGEFVLPKDVVAAIGVNRLESLRRGDLSVLDPFGGQTMQRFQTGGMIRPRTVTTPQAQSTTPTVKVQPSPESGQAQVSNTYTIHAIDSQSFERYLKRNPDALSQGTQNAKRLGFNLE